MWQVQVFVNIFGFFYFTLFARTAKSTWWQVLFFFFFVSFINPWSGLPVRIQWSVFIFSSRDFYGCHFLRWILIGAYTIWSYSPIWISCTILSRSLFPPSHPYSFSASLPHSLIMWLTHSSLSPFNLHLLFYFVLSIFVFIWHYFVLLFKEIHFLVLGFLFLVMFKLCCMQSQQFVAWTIHTVVFFPHFCFLIFCCFYVCFYVANAIIGCCN